MLNKRQQAIDEVRAEIHKLHACHDRAPDDTEFRATESSRARLAVMEKNLNSDELLVAYRRSSYGSNPWSIVNLLTGKVLEFDRCRNSARAFSVFLQLHLYPFEEIQVPVSGQICWPRKKDAVTCLTEVLRLLALPQSELDAELQKSGRTLSPGAQEIRDCLLETGLARASITLGELEGVPTTASRTQPYFQAALNRAEKVRQIR